MVLRDPEISRLEDELHSVKLQVQELRQFALSLMLNMRNVVLPENYCDDWWVQLGSYQQVEKRIKVDELTRSDGWMMSAKEFEAVNEKLVNVLKQPKPLTSEDD
jgi:hypothetical protein